MHSPDKKQLEAFATLSRTMYGKVLMDYLDTEIRDTVDLLIDAPPDKVQWVQSKVRALKDLTTLLAEAHDIAAKLPR